MIKWTTLATECGSFELSALHKDDGTGFGHESLVLFRGREHQRKEEYWDNNHYLIKELYPWLEGKDSPVFDIAELKDVRGELKEVFKEGIKMGFFKDILAKQAIKKALG